MSTGRDERSPGTLSEAQGCAMHTVRGRSFTNCVPVQLSTISRIIKYHVFLPSVMESVSKITVKSTKPTVVVNGMNLQ